MARYIDADRFLERLKASPAFPNMGMDGYFLLDVVEELLNKFPTADVAPKSEVAREIFEEIEKVIGEKYEEYVFDNLDIEGVEQDAIIAFADTMKRHFAELKKKYTEERE